MQSVPGETCCDSFEERKGDSYSDVTGTASPKSEIDCKAVDCMYNENCNCHAGKISVEGSNACHCEQTECATFQCGCKYMLMIREMHSFGRNLFSEKGMLFY